MKIIRQEEVLNLAQRENENLISAYIPTNKFGQQVNEKEDMLKLKNMLKEIRGKLEERNLSRDKIGWLTQPYEDLVNDKTFWNLQENGLAIFRDEEKFEAYVKDEISDWLKE